MADLSWKSTPEIWGLTLLTMGDVAAFQSGFCPSIFTVRQFRAQGSSAQRTASDIYLGMSLGTGLAIMVSLGASYVSGSWLPFAGALVTLALYWAVYQWALQNPANVNSSMA
jgi:hypothetical protein